MRWSEGGREGMTEGGREGDTDGETDGWTDEGNSIDSIFPAEVIQFTRKKKRRWRCFRTVVRLCT